MIFLLFKCFIFDQLVLNWIDFIYNFKVHFSLCEIAILILFSEFQVFSISQSKT